MGQLAGLTRIIGGAAAAGWLMRTGWFSQTSMQCAGLNHRVHWGPAQKLLC